MKLSAFNISGASAARTRWYNSVRRLFERFDYLVMPTAQTFAFDINEHWPHQIAGHTMQTYHEWMKATCLISLSGCPSLAVPAGFDARGRAMGHADRRAHPSRDGLPEAGPCLRKGLGLRAPAATAADHLRVTTSAVCQAGKAANPRCLCP